jgi:hypothetical protein
MLRTPDYSVFLGNSNGQLAFGADTTVSKSHRIVRHITKQTAM